MDLQLALQVANRAADAARKTILARYMGRFSVSAKPDQSPVTEADREAETAIRHIIQQSFPEHAVLGEEFGGQDATGHCWLVDPIDGTVSFIHHIPMFSTLIALTSDREPLVAVVDLPALNRRFTAIRGQGSWEGKKRLAVPPGFEPARSMVCHGDPYQFRAAGREALYHTLEDRITFFRSYTDALGHCLVAAGSASLMVDPDLHSWDVAAPSLIVREAGGRVALHPDDDTGLMTMLSGSAEAVEWVERLL
ncbi:MAG: histidinol phosphate phosphatase [Chloroflexota bacterium]|nr:histidinol phosphate phosphatase [Chloroflexota bacterium]